MKFDILEHLLFSLHVAAIRSEIVGPVYQVKGSKNDRE